MSKSKPDRLRLLVDREYQRWLKGPQMNGWLEVAQQCLKKERARTRRIVEAQRPAFTATQWERGRRDACDAILAALKGTPP